MDLILLVLLLVVVGFFVWFLTTRIPMPPYWATTIQIAALVIIVLYVFTRLIPLPNVMN